MQDVTYNRLAKLLTQIGHRENEKKVSPETIIDYLDYAKEAYLIFDVETTLPDLLRESKPQILLY